ncbi:MAG: hypothetical protein A2W03_08605 [Candidatus Aminicenantes bacterium RBG_16_63_16]|nr:MAG: hypothetical protein A2W03_08605 [Candidatus Aminicenantes bacterium RBG_16_63_16]
MRVSSAGFKSALAIILVTAAAAATGCRSSAHQPAFEGRHFSGRGDVEYLELLEFSRRLFAPDPEFQNLAMLYQPDWNGLVEGPTWNAWWIQNSYGTAYSAMPFLEEPFVTFLQNAQALWFDQMGDGKRRGRPNDEVAPDGSLCDCAGPGWAIYKQGDGQTKIHDWGFEFAAAGIVMQAELLLVTRDAAAIAHYLPMLERTADFIDSRRDPANNLFLVGAAANLLAPSYAGRLKPDGTYDKAYLAGLSITTIAALDRLIELEKLASRQTKAEEFARRRELVQSGLPLLQTAEGYFMKSLDPDGTKHGVFGAARYGYFETSPNHDAIAFRVVPDELGRKIYDAMSAIPELRPFDLILPNYPGLDDMYEKPEGLWKFGHWVNGGHWSTCEARMILAYCRLGKFDDARKSILRMMDYARRFRMDNPLTNFGSEVYQPKEPVNITIDAFGPMAALVRGLFEYIYTAGSLRLYTHIPPAVTELHQKDPIRFGTKMLYLSTFGAGPVSAVRINGAAWSAHDGESVTLSYDKIPDTAAVEIYLGEAASDITLDRLPRPKAGEPTGLVPGGRGAEGDTGAKPNRNDQAKPAAPARAGAQGPGPALTDEVLRSEARWCAFIKEMSAAGFGGTYEAAHARLVLEAVDACRRRINLLSRGAIAPLLEDSRAAADQAYPDAALKLGRGLDAVLKSYRDSGDARKASIYAIYSQVGEGTDGN